MSLHSREFLKKAEFINIKELVKGSESSTSTPSNGSGTENPTNGGGDTPSGGGGNGGSDAPEDE